jgi:hypothetical protein
MSGVSKVTIEELKDFCRCPFLYEKKHILFETPDRKKETADFDGHSYIMIEAAEAIDELVGFYFHRLMDRRQVRYETLYRRWENIWWGDTTGEEIMDSIVPVSRASRVKLNSYLIEHLPKFHKTFKKPFIPAAVGRDIEISNKDMMLTSRIQMAYRVPNKHIRIVKFVPTRIAPGDPTKDIELIAQGCSWMDKHEETSVEVAYYCMMSPREYEPFTVGCINQGTIPTFKRIMQAFQDREAITDINCKGCEYNCEG